MYTITKTKNGLTTTEKINNKTEAIGCFMALIEKVKTFKEVATILEEEGAIREWAGSYGSTVSIERGK